MNFLIQKLNEIVATEGHVGKTRIAFHSGVSVPTIEKVRKGLTSPKSHTAYRLAVAAGFSEQEAKAIASAIEGAKILETA